MDGNDNLKAPPKDVICIDDEAKTKGVPLNDAPVLPQTRGRQWIMGKRPDAQQLDEQSNDPDDNREECELRCREHYPDNPTKHPTAHQKDGFEDNDQDPTNRGIT